MRRMRVADPRVGKKGGKSDSYDDWKVDDLRKQAKELGLSGYSGKTKLGSAVSDRRGSLRASRLAVGLVGLLCLLWGCSQQSGPTDDLSDALNDAHSALASGILGTNLCDQHRMTGAATETLLEDMAKQASDASSSLESMRIPGPDPI
jgi:hypothetical protein